MVFPCYVLKGIEWSLHASSALVSVCLQARALQLLERNEVLRKGRVITKIMHRAPFEVLNFRDHSIPLWGKASSVLGSKTHSYTRTWWSFLIKDGWSLSVNPLCLPV